MSKTFRCNQSGNTVTFHNDYDIKQMYQHPDYTPVEDAEVKETTTTKKSNKVETTSGN